MRVRHIAALGATVAIATAGAIALPSVAADAATKGKISFVLTQSGNSASVIIHGAIDAGGKDTQPKDAYDVAHLAGGTLRITHPNKDATFKFKPDAKTCYYSFVGKGTYTLGHGTGKYQGVKGSGKYQIQGSGIAPKKNGSCNFNSNGGPFAGYATGGGPVTLP
ncbi:hypothetical protein [Jatrophihabitans endophyticus]|uniref:hypothetical protein n=1 Tax=Jatrophihabitans endophyticus TaxID=1206085 RepID=UPI0019E34362|nr:hypothetical protein [Jatrophihabitans endophyticus]MBE7187419.1 hypothetical protein [Jatrophihabitans endophyticus]